MPTRVAAINSSKLLIAISNGASPEVFSHPCMINTNRGIAFTSNPTEVLIPYCPPDEDLAGWIEREGDGLSATVTGAPHLARMVQAAGRRSNSTEHSCPMGL
jgi:hypothetical protein